MAGWAILQTLAGTGDAIARAKQMKTEEQAARDALIEQLATSKQNRALSERKMKVDELYASKYSPTGSLSHLQQKSVALPDGTSILINFDPNTGRSYDMQGNLVTDIKPKPPAPKTVHYGAWQPPDKGTPIIGGMKMWQRDMVDPITGMPTGRKQYGLPNTSVLPNVRHLFKQETDQEGHVFLVPVTESSERTVPGGGASIPPTLAPQDHVIKKLAGGKSATASTTPPQATPGMPRGSIPVGHKPLSVAERKTLADVQQIAGRTDSTLSIFAQHPELKNDNSPITPFLNWMEYSRGHYAPSDPMRLKLIQAAAFLSVKGAAPFTGLGRGKYVLEQVQKHLPQPNDSPKLFYEKLQFLNTLAKDTRKSILDPFAPPEGDSQGQPREEGTIQR